MRCGIAKMRDLGYGIESDSGPQSGYRLGQGTRQLPLICDDAGSGAVGVARREATLSATSKGATRLRCRDRWSCDRARRRGSRTGWVRWAFVRTPRSDERQIAPGTLLELAAACYYGGPASGRRCLRGRSLVRKQGLRGQV
jgi:hypothetical protein